MRGAGFRRRWVMVWIIGDRDVAPQDFTPPPIPSTYIPVPPYAHPSTSNIWQDSQSRKKFSACQRSQSNKLTIHLDLDPRNIFFNCSLTFCVPSLTLFNVFIVPCSLSFPASRFTHTSPFPFLQSANQLKFKRPWTFCCHILLSYISSRIFFPSFHRHFICLSALWHVYNAFTSKNPSNIRDTDSEFARNSSHSSLSVIFGDIGFSLYSRTICDTPATIFKTRHSPVPIRHYSECEFPDYSAPRARSVLIPVLFIVCIWALEHLFMYFDQGLELALCIFHHMNVYNFYVTVHNTKLLIDQAHGY
jgi:hypothetical protein